MALEPRPALASRGPLARWCGAVAGTAQAGKWRLWRAAVVRQRETCLVQVWWCAGGVRCRKVAALHQAPSGSGAQGRERRAALSSVALSPRGVQGVGPARRFARPTRQSTRRSPACQRGQRNGQDSWPGCQLQLCRVASPLLGIMGALPPNPRAPQSLAGRRRWGGVRTPLRRGPRQARCAGLPRVAGCGGWRRCLALAECDRAPRPGH